MTQDRMQLSELLEKADADDIVREMIGFVAQRLMDMDVDNRCGAAHGERSDARTNSRNGYRERDVFTAGYGRQFLNGPVHSFRFEFGPGVRYDEYTDGDTKTQPLGYASGTYAWQFTDNAKFTQGVSVFGADDTTLNSETALNVAINEHFGLKVAYNVTWNSEPPASAPEHTDRRTTISLGYKM